MFISFHLEYWSLLISSSRSYSTSHVYNVVSNSRLPEQGTTYYTYNTIPPEKITNLSDESFHDDVYTIYPVWFTTTLQAVLFQHPLHNNGNLTTVCSYVPKLLHFIFVATVDTDEIPKVKVSSEYEQNCASYGSSKWCQEIGKQEFNR